LDDRLRLLIINVIMPEELQLRIHGEPSLPALIYLPGLHGDWTLIGAFRHAVAGKVRFVEMTYPRTLVWSLDDYATAIETALAQNEITCGWLLGESFGSQPLWALAARKKFRAQGIILAGGFVKHPLRLTVRLAEKIAGRISLRLVIQIIFGYAKIARFRFRRSPEILGHINEFVERRTELDRQAAAHRLHLIAQNDPCKIAKNTNVPVFAITGILDPIVPWFFVSRWLKKNCPALRDYKIIRADHNVLGTGTWEAAKQILKWMNA
jgi:pimeloyl-ACP methyl ester carboxylesterase